MARTPAPRVHYDLEVSRLTGMIRAVEMDELRGEPWVKETLEHLRRARELFSQTPPEKVKRRA